LLLPTVLLTNVANVNDSLCLPCSPWPPWAKQRSYWWSDAKAGVAGIIALRYCRWVCQQTLPMKTQLNECFRWHSLLANPSASSQCDYACLTCLGHTLLFTWRHLRTFSEIGYLWQLKLVSCIVLQNEIPTAKTLYILLYITSIWSIAE